MYFGPAENRKAQALSATGIRPFALTFDIMEMDLHVNWPKCQNLLQHIQKQPVTGSVPPQLIEGVRIQELPPGKGFALNLRQLRFVAEIRIA